MLRQRSWSFWSRFLRLHLWLFQVRIESCNPLLLLCQHQASPCGHSGWHGVQTSRSSLVQDIHAGTMRGCQVATKGTNPAEINFILTSFWFLSRKVASPGQKPQVCG